MYPTDNYVGSFQFRVYVEGINDPLDGFLKVSTCNSFSEPVEWMHGTNINIRKAPGRNNADDVILTRVYQGHDELARWRRWSEADRAQQLTDAGRAANFALSKVRANSTALRTSSFLKIFAR